MTWGPAGEALQRRTAAHYDAYPFDFMTPEDEASIMAMQPPSFRRFIETYAKPGQRVGEIGCGPGRGTLYLVGCGLAVTALDLSGKSIALARGRAPAAHFVQGTNLDLPFADASFDLVVSDGVVHHTPDPLRAFAENTRVLKPGGLGYLGVYNRRRYYYYVYTYLGPVVRMLERSTLGRVLVYMTLFPVYYAIHFIKSRGKRTLRGARNFFYDYIITPRASFHTRDEVEGWARTHQMDIIAYDPKQGNVHSFILRKRTVDLASVVNADEKR